MTDDRNTKTPKHGWVISPASRGSRAIDLGFLLEWEVDELEGGKNFPDLKKGPFPGHSADEPSENPPSDGLILSGGHEDGHREDLNLTNQQLIEKYPKDGKGWTVLSVNPGDDFPVTWKYLASHTTRGYRWFITKDGWDENAAITRDQLELKPFHETISPIDPYNETMVPDENISAPLPKEKTGYHVIILLWIVANTGNAFYQAFDVNFGQPASRP
ncbi:lytic polysaccharide monooxygenase auxiliary activity family 9 protein [Pseudomonas viridiflava]|uniref:lytic polysaccharide monooxygenase auxiliary activity family 9 protein n=1 Tax=Pseudomonas viridiflava TaxID=33069 RepID=UPI001C316BD7|nr:lytic polysaccharide monooxygenase auxiliary activity family 9 protein [Pseudomonas viridiflava]QXG44897.1 lytic polysaccharide monooxygenase [Pseudomonas viridiflava]